MCGVGWGGGGGGRGVVNLVSDNARDSSSLKQSPSSTKIN